MSTPAEAFALVLAVLHRLAIPYLVGGSVASSIHGISRPTMNVDLVADLPAQQADAFAAALGSGLYADPVMIHEAIRAGRAFNLIHLPSTFKVDIFPLLNDEFSRVAFSRRQLQSSRSFGPAPISCSVATPEDVLLRKLERYRAGGEISQRQWNDMRGILQVCRPRLDLVYLRRWAPALHISDLLERLLAE